MLHTLENARSTQEANSAAQFVQMIRYSYMEAGDYEAAAEFGQRLADVLDDESLRLTPEELRRQYEAIQSAQPPAPTADSAQG